MKLNNLVEEDNRKITIEFVNSKKKGIVIYLNYYGHIEELTVNEFEDSLNYNRKPFIEKIYNIIKELSIKYYHVDLGFEKTIKALFSRKRPKADIEIVGEFFQDSDIFMKVGGKIVYDNEELNMKQQIPDNEIAINY